MPNSFANESISKLDYGSFIASSLSYLMLKQRDAVSLTLFDEKIKNFIPPKSNPNHINLIFSKLDKIISGNDTNTSIILHELALKLKLDGVYIPSFNMEFSHLSYSLYNNFTILGSAHNLKEIKIKELQKVKSIFISSLFKKNKNYLGMNKFNILKKYTKKDIVALGGISEINIRKLRLTNISGFAGISYFK